MNNCTSEHLADRICSNTKCNRVVSGPEFVLQVSTAHYIREARRRGFLPPTKRGKVSRPESLGIRLSRDEKVAVADRVLAELKRVTYNNYSGPAIFTYKSHVKYLLDLLGRS
jgi:hypothetical protein